jgi:putative endonuclease
MARHNATGRKGEQLAVEWLKSKGYEILHVNWRYSHYEIDVVAVKDEMLHFIEVKTRRTENFGFPEEAVDDVKINRLLNAGEEFLEQNDGWKRIQYDVLAISINSSGTEYFLIEDVYD